MCRTGGDSTGTGIGTGRLATAIFAVCPPAVTFALTERMTQHNITSNFILAPNGQIRDWTSIT
jgi:hypothetical protein